MTTGVFDREAVLAALRQSWSLDTSTKWTPACPATGQCSVTALVLQDVFGGRLLKTRVGSAWHFYNDIDGAACDLTVEQFSSPISYDHLPATRDEAFADTSPDQYQCLREAFARNWRPS